ncbi:MAG: protoheme IX farnesyltransferase [Acidobacteria bacterium]|nr:MAG: protoheme IX farnesyltransferase [Acidobacteriota bacterium]
MRALISGYLELTKPRITGFILMSTAIGFLLGAQLANGWTWLALFHTLLGTALMASGTAALNQCYEREADAKMARTMARPIPSGRIAASRAAWFGVFLSAVGFTELWIWANPLTGMLGLFTLLSYLFLYTPLKQRSAHSTTIGAIPGAMPPLIGFAAASGTLTWEAWILYAILFLWQFPHFYAIAWIYREDYARAGIRMLSVVEPDGVSTARRIVWFSLALLPISLLPKFTAMAGNVYLAGALALGIMFLWAGIRVAFDHSRSRARQVLLASIIYLPLLYGLLALDSAGS